MPAQIKVEDEAYQQKLVTLNGKSLFLTFSFNTMDRNWYLGIADSEEVDIKTGIKILPKKNLTDYIDLKGLIAGNIYCVDTKSYDSLKVITRDNFGTDRQYQVWYYSDTELESADGTT